MISLSILLNIPFTTETCMYYLALVTALVISISIILSIQIRKSYTQSQYSLLVFDLLTILMLLSFLVLTILDFLEILTGSDKNFIYYTILSILLSTSYRIGSHFIDLVFLPAEKQFLPRKKKILIKSNGSTVFGTRDSSRFERLSN